MRLVVARVNHETNTFSPVPTPLEAFDPQWDEQARASAQGTHTAMGAFLDVAAELRAEVVTPVFATANPSGPVEDAAYEAMSDAIVSAVAKGCDAVLLDLHGAIDQPIQAVALEAPTLAAELPFLMLLTERSPCRLTDLPKREILLRDEGHREEQPEEVLGAPRLRRRARPAAQRV